jgi:hypothetical protein
MESTHLVEKLEIYGELCPEKDIKIWVGEKVLKMPSYFEAVSLRGFYIHPDKYYVFIINKGQILVCDTPQKAVDTAISYRPFDYNIINIGDYVNFGPYGQFYVCGENIGGTKFLVTDDPLQRATRTENGFYLEKSFAEGIIEKYDR